MNKIYGCPVLFCGLLASCSGTVGGASDGVASIDDGPGGGGSGAGGAGASGAASPPVDGKSCQSGVVKAPLRRLTKAEYTNTIGTLLGIVTNLADGFEADTSVAGFATNGIATLSSSGMQDYAEAATALASQINPTKLSACETASTDPAKATCARNFIVNFGKRAFRRPLSPAEVDALFKIYTDKKSRSDFDSAVRLVVEALLQAPSFLYRPDVAGTDESNAARLGRSYELASRLSYFLWGTMPDEKLFASAQSGALLAKEERASQARRMMADERVRSALRSFYDQWLDGPRLATAEKDSQRFPEFGTALKASMREETGRFVQYIYEQREGSLEALLTSPLGFVDAPLAKLYGVAAPATPFAKVDLPASQRSGLLTQAAFLAGHAFAAEPSPIHRGVFVRRNLLCQELALPPGVEIKPPVVDPNTSIRERLAQHRDDPGCAGCHSLMDPIGFGFGHYDAIGRWQTMEGKFPVDANGEIAGTDDIDGKFVGANELGKRLAGSATVQRCMAQQWFRFGLGRQETPEEECLMDQLASQLKTRDLDMRELVIAIATSDAFALGRTN